MLSDVLSPGQDADEVVNAAVAELSAVFGWDQSATWEAVRQGAGDESDPDSLALSVAELYRQAAGHDPDQELAVALAADGDQDWYNRDGYQDGHYVGNGEIALSASYPAEPAEEWHYDPALELAGAVSGEVLRLTAEHGRFFEPDLVAQAQAHIALGAVNELTGDDDYETVEDAHRGSEIERLSMANDALHLPKGISKIHDTDAGHPFGRGHHAGCSKACTRDHAAPSDGGETHPEVDRLLGLLGAKMGNKERPHGSSTIHRPFRPDELHRARTAAAGRSAGKLTY